MKNLTQFAIEKKIEVIMKIQTLSPSCQWEVNEVDKKNPTDDPSGCRNASNAQNRLFWYSLSGDFALCSLITSFQTNL